MKLEWKAVTPIFNEGSRDMDLTRRSYPASDCHCPATAIQHLRLPSQPLAHAQLACQGFQKVALASALTTRVFKFLYCDLNIIAVLCFQPDHELEHVGRTAVT
jgi:hypothetical protein